MIWIFLFIPMFTRLMLVLLIDKYIVLRFKKENIKIM